jgi:hypothetical protein
MEGSFSLSIWLVWDGREGESEMERCSLGVGGKEGKDIRMGMGNMRLLDHVGGGIMG